MFLFLLVATSAPAIAATRHYYIAAEDLTWDYAPSGMDLLEGQGIRLPWAGNTRWPKTHYIEYTDATFTVRKPQPAWLGILGPVIRAEVGDGIIVDFLNRSKLPHSIHPHGLRYDKADEGALYLSGGAGSRVLPGGHFTYHWRADEGSGPGKGQGSSIVWWYHGHTDEPTETNAGLLGPIVVTSKGKARPDATPTGVDREFVAMFMIFDELHRNSEGLFYSINGYIFGNLPGLVMKKGERIRWYLLGTGNEIDLHTPHWHGETVLYGTKHTDVVELLPGSMATVDMVADNPGTWMFHCHVSEHMESGMTAEYTIYQPQPCSSPLQVVSTDFWHTPGKLRVTVKNTSAKPTRSIFVDFDYLMTMQYRRRPWQNEWKWDAAIQPGQEQTFEMQGFQRDLGNAVFGWVLFPKRVIYQDGSSWSPAASAEPPGLYWYHPHIHGVAEAAVQGGASGAIVVDGIESIQPAVTGLPQRLLLMRDQLTPCGDNCPEDAPAWDMSLNYVPVLYPQYKTAIIQMTAGAREFWRVGNISADTILDLELQYDGHSQPLEIIALDGVPVGSQDGTRRGKSFARNHILIPPAGRAEFIVSAPDKKVKNAVLVTHQVDTGPDGDVDPDRPIATIQTIPNGSSLKSSTLTPKTKIGPPWRQRFEGLGNAKVTARRKLYFSEDNPDSQFFITVEGQTPTLFNPNNPPAIVTTQGSVEEWTVENRALENHEFHMHQIHFMLMARNGVPVSAKDRQFLDMVDLPYWKGSGPYPSVTLRMDFRGPDIGDFVYHCHILEHEDKGMMAIIRVLPANNGANANSTKLDRPSAGSGPPPASHNHGNHALRGSDSAEAKQSQPDHHMTSSMLMNHDSIKAGATP